MGRTFKFGGGSRTRGAKPTSRGGKVFLTLFLSVFIVVGGLGTAQLVKDADRRADQQAWDEAPCEILTSRVEIDGVDNEPYSPRVTYRYMFGGRSYTGRVAIEGGYQTDDYAQAQDVTRRYPEGASRTALVNPDDPSDAILEAAPLGRSLLFLLVPLLFCLVPLCILVVVWWPRGGGGKGKVQSISDKAGPKRLGPVGLTIFGLVFFLVGLGVGLPLTVRPTLRTLNAQGWPQVPAQVERSAVLTFDGDDGDTYRADILYRYEIDGQTYRSNRYSFMSFGSSSGYDSKRELVDAHPVGKQIVCFVNPEDPSQSVLVRGWRLANLLGLIPLPFVLIGAGVMVSGLRKIARGEPDAWSGGLSIDPNKADDRGAQADAGPVTLRPRMSRVGKAAGLLCFGLFWNGIVSVFGYQVVDRYIDGNPDLCLTVFLIPFVLVGLGIMVGFFQSLLLIAAPVVELTLERRAIPLGGAAKLSWRVAGRPGKLHALTITLVGTESVTYRRGTDTITDTHDFYEAHLVGGERAEADAAACLARPADPDRGELTLRIPAQTMHSFKAGNNKAAWKLKVRAWVPRWPDPKDEYEVRILPMEVGG